MLNADLGAHEVLNASNPAAALGSGISRAIREACGGVAFQRKTGERLEEDFGAELEKGDSVVTSSDSCRAFRWVLHVPAVDYYGKRDPRRADRGDRAASRRACARRSPSRRARAGHGLAGQFVIATRLLGAGAGGLGTIISLDAMMRGVHEHLRATSPAERHAVAKLVFAVLRAEDARLVELAAAKHRLPVAV
jgi:O-acetyl-ADP-ribose deacetylase (regulator of RNase III)